MPRKPKAPSYRLHKHSGQAIVHIHGRDHYLGPYDSSESYAKHKRLLAEVWAQPASIAPGGHDATVCELVDSYLTYADGYYVKNGRPTGEISCLKEAVRPLVKLYGHTPAADFGPVALKAVREQWIEGGISRTVINSRVNRIRRVFKWAVENEIVPSTVLVGLQAVPGLKKGRSGARETEPVGPAPAEQVEAVLAIAPEVIAAMIRLQLLSGMRPNEVVQLRRCDLDTSRQTWEYVPAEHKTEHHGKQRVIYFGPQARAILDPLLGLEFDAPIFSPMKRMATKSAERRQERKTPMTPSQAARQPKENAKRKPGAAYTTMSYGRAVARLCEQAMPWPGLNGRKREELTPEEKDEERAWRKAHSWSPNRLRHTCATQVRRDAGLETASAVLGHSEVETTQIYAERDAQKAREYMEKAG